MRCGYMLRDCEAESTRMFVRRDHPPVPLCDPHAKLAEYAIAGGCPAELATLEEWQTREAALPVGTRGH